MVQDSGAIYINSSWLAIIKWRGLEFVTISNGFSVPWFETMLKYQARTTTKVNKLTDLL